MHCFSGCGGSINYSGVHFKYPHDDSHGREGVKICSACLYVCLFITLLGIEFM